MVSIPNLSLSSGAFGGNFGDVYFNTTNKIVKNPVGAETLNDEVGVSFDVGGRVPKGNFPLILAGGALAFVAYLRLR